MLVTGASELLELLDNPIHDPPPGWYTVMQIAKMTGLSWAAAKARIRKGMADGSLKRATYRCLLSDGTNRPIAHYYLGEKSLRRKRK